MNIIFPGYDYKTLLTIAGVNTLCSRCQELTPPFYICILYFIFLFCILYFYIRHVQNET